MDINVNSARAVLVPVSARREIVRLVLFSLLCLGLLFGCSKRPSSASSPSSTYTVTYNANGATGGSLPIDSNKYLQGATVTVLGNTGTLVRTGYALTRWNTKSDGTGTSYAARANFTIGSSNVSLFAVWAPLYTVTYNANGATGGSLPIDSNNYPQGTRVIVSGNPGNLARTGYTFADWNTKADGRGTGYAADATFPMGTANVTLYAVWAENQ